MNEAKLEALRNLAADERTPIEEARNAALLFVRGGGAVGPSVAPPAPPLDEVTALRDRVSELEKKGLEILQRLWDAEAEAKRQHRYACEANSYAYRLETDNREIRAHLEAIVKADRAMIEAEEARIKAIDEASRRLWKEAPKRERS